jgi:carboxyl-terminal processing protease
METTKRTGMPGSTVILISVFVFLMGIALGSVFTPLKDLINSKVQETASTIGGGGLKDQNFNLYWEVYNTLKDEYVDPNKLNSDEMYYGSIKGMVESLNDPATAFFDPKETSDYNKSRGGEYEGIGAELDYVNKQVVILSPFDGSPAKAAGLESGDIITKVDGQSMAGKNVTEVVSLIRGKSGSQVAITISRPKESYKVYEFKITRGNISAPSMSIKEIKDGVAVVKVNRFTEATYSDWQVKWNGIVRQLEAEIKKGTVKSIVLDLRGNPGGYFDAAVYMASDFVPQGSLISLQRDKDQIDTEYRTTQKPRLENVPLVVMVNGGSASASEIFAGAMKFHKRATLIGEKTYGKGTAQIVIPLKDGASLHVTVSKWLLPNKEWINPENPIIPDKIVALDETQRDNGVDSQLVEAIKTAKALHK